MFFLFFFKILALVVWKLLSRVHTTEGTFEVFWSSVCSDVLCLLSFSLLVSATSPHLFPSLHFVMSHWQLEMDHGAIVCTTELARAARQGGSSLPLLPLSPPPSSFLHIPECFPGTGDVPRGT